MKALHLSSLNPARRLPSVSVWLPLTLLVFAGLFVAVFMGMVTALGNKYLLLPFAALFGAVFVIAVPATWTIWMLYVSGFVIVGPIVYFSGFSQLQWVPSLMGAVVLLQVMTHAMKRGEQATTQANVPLFVALIMIWLLMAILSTIIDAPTFSELLISSRWYFFMWPVMLAFMLGVVKPGTWERIWKFLLIAVLLQVPMVLYQFFVVSKRSSWSAVWDVVVGTFPGGEESGGQSAAMAIFLLIGMLLAIALWRARKMKGRLAALVCLAGLGAIAFAEVKAAVLLMPVVLALYFRRTIVRNLGVALLASLGVVALVVLMLKGYEHFHYAAKAEQVRNYSTSATEKILNVLDPESEAAAKGQLGRVTHLVFWWKHNVEVGDIQHALLGYGMGSTQVTRIGVGDIARKYPYAMDASSSTILLWETGLLGHLLFVLAMLAAARVSARGARSDAVPEMQRVLLGVGAVGLVLLTITLPYKSIALRSVPMQLLLMLLLGQAAYWARHAPHAGTQSKRALLHA
jgi:hypothetical protein